MKKRSRKKQSFTRLWLPYPLYKALVNSDRYGWADRIYTAIFTAVGTIVAVVGLKILLVE